MFSQVFFLLFFSVLLQSACNESNGNGADDEEEDESAVLGGSVDHDDVDMGGSANGTKEATASQDVIEKSEGKTGKKTYVYSTRINWGGCGQWIDKRNVCGLGI